MKVGEKMKFIKIAYMTYKLLYTTSLSIIYHSNIACYKDVQKNLCSCDIKFYIQIHAIILYEFNNITHIYY